MASLSIPSEGLLVRHESTKSQDPPRRPPTQVIRLDLIETVTKEILRSLKDNEQVRLRCGKKPAVQLGKRSILLENTVDSFPSEVFARSADDDGALYFAGLSSHKFEARKAEEDTAKTDEALATLRNTLRSLQQERASNETSLKEGGEKGKHGSHKEPRPSPLMAQGSALRKDHLLGALSRSTPSSPFLSASYSPRQGPTSAPLPSGTSTKDRIRLDAIRIPLVHLLAVRPMTCKAISARLRASQDDIGKLIDKVSWESKAEDGKRELKEKCYRELDVWKFPFPSQEERQAAIQHAIQAYDRMRIEKKDSLWQMLLQPEERGKGMILSRLNFNKPPVAPKPEQVSEEGNESRNETSDREAGRVQAKTEKGAAITGKARKDQIPPEKKLTKRPGSGPAKAKDSSQGRPAKADGKFKSSEVIEDSDEEAGAAEEVVTKSREGERAKDKDSASSKPGLQATARRRPDQDLVKTSKSPLSHSSPKGNVHKASLSSSSGSGSGNEKPRAGGSNSSTSRVLKPHPHQRTESTTSRISPRPRHNSSPQKPSPLGSSPPTTSTDVDNSGSSKSSNQSSAPSSPPSGNELPQQQATNKYSPILSDKSRNASRGRSPAANSVKRKGGPTDEERPAKRQQPATQQSSARTAPTHNVTGEQSKRPAPVRNLTERSSSPEKRGPKVEDVMEDARRFQRYYKKYKDLYDKISQVNEKERDDKDMDDLWKMHKRLKEMKADIWDNWGKVEKDKMDKIDLGREMVAV